MTQIAQQHIVRPDNVHCHQCRQPIAGPFAWRRLSDRTWWCVACWAELHPAPAPEPVAPPVPVSAPATADPLSVACIRCRAPAGQRCRNYKGQNKATCSERGKRLVDTDLFGGTP